MSRIEDGGAVEAGLVEQSLRDAAMVSLAEEITWGSAAASRPVSVPRGLLNFAAAEITRLRAENAGMREALSAIVSALAEQDDEGLIEFAPEMQRARAALSNSSQAEGQKP